MTSFIPELEKAILVQSDIHQHLSILWAFASRCERVIECGVRTPTSTWALLQGLKDNNKKKKELISVDLYECPGEDTVKARAKEMEVEWKFLQENDIKLDFEKIGPVDMIFIDTWHIYGHLKRELAHFHKNVNRWILLHDTSVDSFFGESIRNGSNVLEESKQSGYPVEEITKGLWPAVEEFLQANKDWKLKARFNHNNGLTILERIEKE